MVRKLFIYTGIVIWHFEKAKKKKKKPEISIFVTIFVEKCYFRLYFTAEIRQRVDYYPENIFNHILQDILTVWSGNLVCMLK